MTEIEFKQHALITMNRINYREDAYNIIKYHPRYKILWTLGILDITIQPNPHNHSQKNFVIETRLPYKDSCFTIVGIEKAWAGYHVS